MTPSEPAAPTRSIVSTTFVLPRARPGRVDRLRRRRDFTAVLRAGRRGRRPLCAVAVRPNHRGQTRVGYAVGRRVGGAVVRNRVRRRLRALVDELLGPLEIAALRATPGAADTRVTVDIVITAFGEAVGASFEALRRDLASALRAAGVQGAEPGEPGESHDTSEPPRPEPTS